MYAPAGPAIVDREREQAELRRLLAARTPKLGLLTGRRRVGKTYLLTHAWGDTPYFLFTAARTTGEVNRRQLLLDLAAWSGEEIRLEDYPTWRSVFNLLLEFKAPEPLVVVVDEFQHLADDPASVTSVGSELNAAWERRREPRPMLLILSGSAVGTMEALAAGGGPLYGRFDWQRRLRPFDYWYAAELAPFPGERDRALAYGIFGGTPKYLAAVDPAESLADNATRLLLAPSGQVRLLVETALDQEDGLRDVSKYRAILRAVAGGCTGRNDIAQRTGLANDAGLRDKLGRLIDLGYLETLKNFDARANEPVRYGISDPAFRFHQRFVEPAVSMLERYPANEVWRDSVLPHLDAYMGHEFERIAAECYDRRRAALDLSIVERWGRWEGMDRTRRSLEIDIVAALLGGGVLTGAVKWDHAPIGAHVHREHLDMLKRAADAGRGWAHKALEPGSPILYVAAGGFSPGFIETVNESDHPVICWALGDLYAA